MVNVVGFMNAILHEANILLSKGKFEYAVCGGFAIDLFLNTETRKHSDIDVSAYAMNEYFRAVSKLLKKDGQIFISEIHPFVHFFDNGFDFDKQNLNKFTSYFSKGPYNYALGIDYVGGVTYESDECFWFMHKISDIITAILHADIEIQEFDEYNLGNSQNEILKLLDGFPLSYILIGKKKA